MEKAWTVSKSEIVSGVAKSTGLTKSQADSAINGFINEIIDVLKEGGSVSIAGFGTFRVVDRGPRNGRNPFTGEPLSIPAKRIPKFVPGKNFRNLLN